MFLNTMLCFFCAVYGANALKILGVFPVVSHSHFTIGYTLLEELAKRGHEVSMITPFPKKDQNESLSRIVLTGFVEEWDKMMKGHSPMEFHNKPAIFNLFFMSSMGIKMVEDTLSHENVQKMLKSDQKFDVVLVEHFIFDGLLAIAHHVGAQPVFISTIGPSMWSNHLVGNADVPSYMGSIFISPPFHDYFCKRLHNFMLYLLQKIIDHLWLYPKQNAAVQKYIENSPHIYEIIYNASLFIFNSDHSYSQTIPTLPNMVEIGGFHVKPPRQLPEDLQRILDNAKNGVIYFSMGSVLKSKDLPLKVREGILRALSKVKETVLWKFEEDLPDKPPNVIIRSWFPQADVLAHPNVKLFITHGGLLSTIESLHRGVPVVGIPVFGDQSINMANAVSRGQGIAVPLKQLSETTLTQALNEVLDNPQYIENAKKASQILKDQLLNPIDKVEYWIEYVVRHKGARHLRPASLELMWYQHLSLDVVLFLTAVTLISCVISYKIMKRLLCRKKIKKEKTS